MSQPEKWVVVAVHNEEDIEDIMKLARDKLVAEKAFFCGVYQSQEQIAREFTEDLEEHDVDDEDDIEKVQP